MGVLAPCGSSANAVPAHLAHGDHLGACMEEQALLSNEKSDNSGYTKIRPNPFTTSTTIEYELQHSSTVQITIYNHLGEQIELIQQKQSSGKQQIVWNAKGLPSGVYYFRLQADGKVATGKLVLVR